MVCWIQIFQSVTGKTILSNLKSVLVMTVVILLSVSTRTVCAKPFSNQPSFEFLEMKKDVKGRVTQGFNINLPEALISRLLVLYRQDFDPKVYKALISGTEFSIQVNSPSRIRLFIIERNHQSISVSHTTFMLWGDSNAPLNDRVFAASDEITFLNNLPYIGLKEPERFYWHQTGESLSFELKRFFDLSIPPVFAYENNKVHSLSLVSKSPVIFEYTPPHDLNLRQKGGTAFRQDMILTQFIHGSIRYTLCYVLKVHRSRYAHDNQIAGHLVLGIGILFFTGMVIKKRRASPWWNG